MSNENKINNQEDKSEYNDVVEDNNDKIDAVEGDSIEENTGKNKKKKSFKSKVILIETIILVIVLAVVYLYYNNQSEKINEINESSKKLEILNQELNNCQNLVTEDQVNPDEYDYCRSLLREFK